MILILCKTVCLEVFYKAAVTIPWLKLISKEKRMITISRNCPCMVQIFRLGVK
jgi:hypothetical protein